MTYVRDRCWLGCSQSCSAQSPLRVNDLAISDTDDKILPMNHRVVDDWLDGIRAEQACVRFQMFVGVYKVESTAVSIANDISLATQCSTLCGYTRQDIETAFPLELDHLVALNQASSRSAPCPGCNVNSESVVVFQRYAARQDRSLVRGILMGPDGGL